MELDQWSACINKFGFIQFIFHWQTCPILAPCENFPTFPKVMWLVVFQIHLNNVSSLVVLPKMTGEMLRLWKSCPGPVVAHYHCKSFCRSKQQAMLNRIGTTVRQLNWMAVFKSHFLQISAQQFQPTRHAGQLLLEKKGRSRKISLV